VRHIDGVEVCDVLAGGQSVGAGHGARATGEKLPIQQLVTRKPIYSFLSLEFPSRPGCVDVVAAESDVFWPRCW
jgi:hypothetical protein